MPATELRNKIRARTLFELWPDIYYHAVIEEIYRIEREEEGVIAMPSVHNEWIVNPNMGYIRDDIA